MDKLKKIAGNIFYFTCSHFVNFGLGLIASVVLARTLGPNELGIFHQVQWFAGTISVVISLGFITSVTKFTAQFKAQGRDANIVAAVRFIFWIEMGIAVLSTALLLFFSAEIADHYFSPSQNRLFIISFIAITPGLQTAIFSAVLEGVQLFKYQTLHSITITPIALLTKVYLMLGGFPLESLFWSNLIFAIINLAFYFWAARREGLLWGWFSRKGDKKWRGELLRYNRSVVGIHFIDLVVWARSENYFLGRYCAASQIAYYNLAQNLVGKFFGLIPNLLWKILLPLSAEHHGKLESDKIKRTYHHALRYSAFALFPTITICFISAYELIVIFFGREYLEVKGCFQILCVGALLTTLAQPGSAAIYAANRQGFILYYGGVLAVLNIALNFLLIPKLGAVGAAICYSVTTTLGVIGGFVFTTMKMNLSIPWGAWAKAALGSLGMGMALSWLLGINSGLFGCLSGLQGFLGKLTGYNFEIFLGYRTVRLLFSVLVSMGLYLGLCIVFFKPQPDDVKILTALASLLPRRMVRLLLSKAR